MCVRIGNIFTVRFAILCSILLWFLFNHATADAQPVDLQISRLINSGQIEAAERVLEASNPNEIARLFFAGRVLKFLQKYSTAIEIFEEILDRKPDHINAKRELAHVLILVKDLGGAEKYFRELLLIDNNEVMQNGYRRFLSVIDQNRPSGVGMQFSLLPSSNINKGTSNTVFDSALGDFIIGPSMQAESGLGARFGLSGFFRHLVSPLSKVEINWAIFGTKFGNGVYDSIEKALSISYEKRTLTGQWSLEGYARHGRRNGGEEVRTLGGRYEFSKSISADNSVAFLVSHEYRNYPLTAYRNGPITRSAISITHQFDAGLSVSGGIQSESSQPDTEHLQYISYETFGRISKVWNDETHATVGFRMGGREFSGVYPLTNISRLDSYSGFDFSVNNNRIQYLGFTPKLSCAFNSNSSNVSFFDFSAADCSVRVSKEF